MEKYFDAFEFILNKSQVGVKMNNSETDTKFIVPYLKVLDYIKLLLEKILR